MLKRFLVFLSVCLVICCSCTNVYAKNNAELSNKFFAFTMPDETKGTYIVDKIDNGIFISETVSYKAQMGGFAFGFQVFKKPSEYVDIPGSKKLGELTTPKGVIYDLVLMRPTEIQYIDSKEVKKNYTQLYDIAQNIEIRGINGNKYVKNKGMKGQDLYGKILKKYKTAFAENWTSERYEKEKMGYMYSVLSKEKKNLLDTIGYIYFDINADGIDELIIGENKDNKSPSAIYDVYTMVERIPTHVFSGGDVDKFFVCYSDVFFCNEYSSAKNNKTTTIFSLETNSAKLYPINILLYDVSKNKKKPYYQKYANNSDYNNISKKEYKKLLKLYDKYKRFDFLPFNTFE